VQLGKSANETYNLIQQVYGGEALSCALVFEWRKRFREDGRQWKMMWDLAYHPPRELPRTLTESEICCNKPSNYLPNFVRGSEQQQDDLPQNFAWESWQQKTEFQTLTAHPISRAKGESFYNLCRLFRRAGNKYKIKNLAIPTLLLKLFEELYEAFL